VLPIGISDFACVQGRFVRWFVNNLIVLRKRNGSVLTQKSGFCKELKTACWRVYIRSKAIFIKEFPEAGWVAKESWPAIKKFLNICN